MAGFHYNSTESKATVALIQWSFHALERCSSRVLPDGCRDFIVKQSHDGASSWFVSDLSESSYTVDSKAHERLSGVRLQPGVLINEPQLRRWLINKDPSDLLGTDQLDEFCICSAALSEALDCLSSKVWSVSLAASELGVSARTLQRFVKSKTQHSPYFWISLARVRAAGRLLVKGEQLVDVAASTGFSDQAHMTREMKKWFGVSPSKLRNDDELLLLLCEPGYGLLAP